MDDATFLRGRYNPEEGGPKGIDVDRDMSVLATTCEHQPLAFFDLGRDTGQAQAVPRRFDFPLRESTLHRTPRQPASRVPADDMHRQDVPRLAHAAAESGSSIAAARAG